MYYFRVNQRTENGLACERGYIGAVVVISCHPDAVPLSTAVQTEPVASTSAETKPVASTSAETKPVASTSAETKPVASTSAETKPVVSTSAETKPVASTATPDCQPIQQEGTESIANSCTDATKPPHPSARTSLAQNTKSSGGKKLKQSHGKKWVLRSHSKRTEEHGLGGTRQQQSPEGTPVTQQPSPGETGQLLSGDGVLQRQNRCGECAGCQRKHDCRECDPCT